MSAKIIDRIKLHLTDDDHRYRFQIMLLPVIFALISLSMSILNYFTGEHILMTVTFAFTIISIACSLATLLRPSLTTLSYIVFNAIISAMLIYFTVTGAADGFSPLWILLMPTCGMIFSGRRMGSIFCALIFAALVFLMWTPTGRQILCYEYTHTFLMRFPLLYIACYFIGLFFEITRKMTYDSLKQAQHELLQLSLRDGMTGICNRSKFSQDIDAIASDENSKPVGFIYVDINGLKRTNDTLSHDVGDSLIENCVGIMTARFSRDICYRLGGDEFLIILRNCTREHLDSQLKNLRHDFSVTDKVSVSLGSAFAESGKDVHAAVIAADADMQKDKSTYYRTTGIDRRR